MQTIVSTNTTAINDHRLGATLGFLGYPVAHLQSTIHEGSRQKHVQFFFEQHSVRFPSLPSLDDLLKAWRTNALTDPHHLMNVCTRAHHNYDAMIAWQKEGRQHILRPIDHSLAYKYEPGTLPAFDNGALKPIDHLQLAAALAEIGFQTLRIAGSGREHTYTLPPFGLPLIDSAGVSFRYELAKIAVLAPVRDDPRRLALEITQPMHPLVIAYTCLRSRAVFKEEIERIKAKILIEEGGRQAIIHMNAPGRVMDHVTAHFKAPPLPQ